MSSGCCSAHVGTNILAACTAVLFWVAYCTANFIAGFSMPYIDIVTTFLLGNFLVMLFCSVCPPNVPNNIAFVKLFLTKIVVLNSVFIVSVEPVAHGNGLRFFVELEQDFSFIIATTAALVLATCYLVVLAIECSRCTTEIGSGYFTLNIVTAMVCAGILLVQTGHLSLVGGFKNNYSMEYSDGCVRHLFPDQCTGDIDDYAVPCEIFNCWGFSGANYMPATLSSLSNMYLYKITPELTVAAVALLVFCGFLFSHALLEAVAVKKRKNKKEARKLIEKLRALTKILVATAATVGIVASVRGISTLVSYNFFEVMQKVDDTLYDNLLCPCGTLATRVSDHANNAKMMIYPGIIFVFCMVIFFGTTLSCTEAPSMVIAAVKYPASGMSVVHPPVGTVKTRWA